MGKTQYRTTLALSTFSVFIICLLTTCESSAPVDRPSFEQPKFIIQLDETKLLVSEVVTDLNEPWEVTWGADEHLWFTEKKGNIMRLNPTTGSVNSVLSIKNVYTGRTPGLLGMVLHPDFNNEPFVYAHYTYIDSTLTGEFDRTGNPNYRRSKVMRYSYSFQEDTLKHPVVIMPDIPGNGSHNGSRLAISEDNKLLLAIGDVSNSRNAQTELTIPGKILRMNLDGSVPDDNPIPGNHFYSMGHRNPQGLVTVKGKIYSSEHGPDNDDEINLIKPGENYGWPLVEGYCDKENEMAFCDSVTVTEPIYDWTPTIAPAGLDYYNHPAIPEWGNSLMLATLKGQSLWLFELDDTGEKIVNERIYLQQQLGRLRDLCVSPTGDVYLITSNTDWNVPRYKWMYEDVPKDGNDRILKISAIQDHEEGKFDDLITVTEDIVPTKMLVQYGRNGRPFTPQALLYRGNCASCHMPEGEGIPDFTPPLIGTATVADKRKLIESTLFGLSGEIEVKGKKYDDVMPGFAASLTNQELKDILNYIRFTGNNFTDSVTVEEIEEVRKSRVF